MKVFLSYAHSDEDLARKVRDALREAGLEVWDDRLEIFPGDNWAEKVAEALRESNAMVVLFSPDAAHSQRVRREIEYALGEKRYKNRLIPVIVGPREKIPEDNIPWILRHLRVIELPERERDDDIKQIAQALLKAA